MMICAATGRAIGRLRGFIVDVAEEQIRYLVVRGSGLFSKASLLPFATPRLDSERGTINVDVSDQELWQLRNFSPDALLT